MVAVFAEVVMGRHGLLAGAVAGFSVLAAGPLHAAVVCTGPGYPPVCVEVEAAPVRVYARPVATPGGPGDPRRQQ